jgi:hypothetical protein
MVCKSFLRVKLFGAEKQTKATIAAADYLFINNFPNVDVLQFKKVSRQTVQHADQPSINFNSAGFFWGPGHTRWFPRDDIC